MRGGVVILLLLVYKFGIRRSIDAWTEYSGAKEKVATIGDLPEQNMIIMNKLQKLESAISASTEKKEAQQQLLDLLTEYCYKNKVVLREFPERDLSEDSELIIETNRFVIQGDFHSLLELVYQLERKPTLGMVSSVCYELRKETASRNVVLTATVYLQNLKQKPEVNS